MPPAGAGKVRGPGGAWGGRGHQMAPRFSSVLRGGARGRAAHGATATRRAARHGSRTDFPLSTVPPKSASASSDENAAASPAPAAPPLIVAAIKRNSSFAASKLAILMAEGVNERDCAASGTFDDRPASSDDSECGGGDASGVS